MGQLLAELRRRRDLGALSEPWLDDVAAEASDGFLDHFHASGGYLSDAISILCEIATLEAPELARPGVRGLFVFLVERLSDAFDPRYCGLYDRLFVQVVTFCRHRPEGRDLDAALAGFGLHTARGLLGRKRRLGAMAPWPMAGRDEVRIVLLLSRVTLGADVAVTSVCMAGAKEAFPDAELVLIGLAGVAHLFAADSWVRVHEVAYDRGGDLLSRLNAWLDVLEAVRSELGGLLPAEYVVIDPDSRLTQLGVFPLLADDGRYLYFESRGYRAPGLERIGELAGHWLAARLGLGTAPLPWIAPAAADLETGRRIRRSVRGKSIAKLVVVNLGVGGNERKRLGDAFEVNVLRGLLDQGHHVILAKGVGAEVARAERLAAALEVERRNESDAPSARLITWQGSVGEYCGLIAAADLYVGYDSSGQHLAGALGVPTVDVFVDVHHPMIAKRWRPLGPAQVATVQASDGDRTGI